MFSLAICAISVAFVANVHGLSVVDDATLQKIDVAVRKNLLTQIAPKVSADLAEIKRLSTECEAKINSAIESCKTCTANICQPSVVDKVVNTVENAAHSVGHAIGHIFGRRGIKRCTTSCPICETIDTSKHTKEQTLIAVCGSTSINTQKRLTDTVKRLNAAYEAMRTHAFITKVEYDAASIRTDGGVSFTTDFLTYTVSGHATRFQSSTPLYIADVDRTATSFAKQILPRL